MDNLLEDSRIKDFFPAYEKQLYDAWKQAVDPEAREECHRLWLAAKKFETHFRSYILDGKLVELKEAS